MKVAPIFLLCFHLSSCATIFSGQTEEVPLTILPANAHVEYRDAITGTHTASVAVEGDSVGRVMLMLSRGHHDTIHISSPGFRDVSVIFGEKTNPVVFSNLLLISPLAPLIDIGTNAAYSVSPSSLQVKLERGTSPEEPVIFPDNGTAIPYLVLALSIGVVTWFGIELHNNLLP